MNISFLCRSCMKEIKLMDIDNYNEKIVEMFSYCTRIEVSSRDHLTSSNTKCNELPVTSVIIIKPSYLSISKIWG